MLTKTDSSAKHTDGGMGNLDVVHPHVVDEGVIIHRARRRDVDCHTTDPTAHHQLRIANGAGAESPAPLLRAVVTPCR